MKKRICALTAVFLLVLSVTAGAVETRELTPRPTLSFSGTTATCAVNIRADSLSDKISATVKLWDGNTCLKTWTDSGTGYLFFSETHSKDIEPGKSYTMTVDYTIAGKSYPQLSTSAVCRK
ncbi:MAG: hypothetical protein Q4C45_09985 [Oscillospiraceae bacterium]|nr:hypothetical protein [Oscillospiraceae bacterium]